MAKSARSDSHENDDFSGSPKVESQSYSFEMKQNNFMEFLGYWKFEFYNQNGLPDPPRPQHRNFPISPYRAPIEPLQSNAV